MRKILFAIITIIFFSECTNSNQENDILPNVPVSQSINLSLPSYVNLSVPAGFSYVPGGLKGMIVYNVNGTEFKAYERAAPHLPVSNNCSQMVFENGIKMRCPCDDSEFSILDGAPLTEGVSYFAREYLATKLSENVLQITNF
jgi:nitrite reductase/ring-hydroxylating ferredoxin subunit